VHFETGPVDGRARAGLLALGHGEVETPAFMPVGTNASVKAVRPDALEALGVRMILSNTYHLYLRPGIDAVEAAGGLHRFMGWGGNILTDSGGFQLFSLTPFRRVDDGGVAFSSHLDGSRHRLTPEDVIDAQVSLASDVMMPLDVCTPPGIDRGEAEEAAAQTTRWARRSRARWREHAERGEPGRLFGIVQGNFYRDLRLRSAEEILALDLPGYAIGGLSVGEEPGRFRDMLAFTAALLPADRPRYVMGIGTPEYILHAVEEGIDLFDCVYPTRTARNALALTRDGNLNLRLERNRLDRRPIDSECGCYACRTFSRSYLRHLFKAKEILAAVLTTEHNLRFIQDLIVEARGAIRDGRFAAWSRAFADRRSRGVP
jgi:queuine tRNA-ribosyltransferase